MKIKRISKTKLYFLITTAAVLIMVGFWLSGLSRSEVEIVAGQKKNILPAASLTGEECENGGSRPFAVMLASDPTARPLSGIAMADVVVEMPVTPGGITRVMALYQCETPSVIGSIRSARDPFLSVAAGFDAVYAHWGGEKEALEKLNNKILDNIDALDDPYNAFYRQAGILAPHNGFSSYERIKNSAEKFSYRLSNRFEGYPRGELGGDKNISQIVSEISVNYEKPYDIIWRYDAGTGIYKRFRNGVVETDKLTRNAVEVSNVIVLKTNWKPLGGQYIDIGIIGSGEAVLYRNGVAKSIKWSKDSFNGKLKFLNNEGGEAEFAPGKVWINYAVN